MAHAVTFRIRERLHVRLDDFGIEAATGAVHAPDGFGDLEAGILRMNPLSGNRHDLFRRKAESYRARWPWLSIAEPGPKGGPLTP